MNALKRKRINFYEVYTRKPDMSAKTKSTLGYLLPAVGIAAVGALAVGLQYAEINRVSDQIAVERAYLADPEVSAKYDEYNELYYRVAALNAVSDDLGGALAAIHSFPDMRAALLTAADEDAGDTIILSSAQYDEVTGLLVVSGSSRDVTDASGFARRLEQISDFYDVDYTGYQNDSDGRYYFTMQCLLYGGANKGVQ